MIRSILVVLAVLSFAACGSNGSENREGVDEQINVAHRAQVERLLKSHEQAGSFLDNPAPELQATMLQEEAGDARAQSLQAGLAAAFTEEQAIVLSDGNHSVLKMLGNTITEVPRVLLRESKPRG